MSLVRSIVDPIVRPIVPSIGDGALPWDAADVGVTPIESLLLSLPTLGPAWQGLYVGEDGSAYRTLSGTAVTEWLDVSGRGRHATQSTGTARPTWDPIGINGMPALSFDGGDELHTGAMDLTAFDRVLVMSLLSDSIATTYIAHDFAGVAAGRCALVNNDTAATVATYGRTAASNIEARSAASFTMSTPAVLTGTVDYTAVTNAAEIRHGGVNVTSTRPTNPDASAATVANGVFSIGNRAGADLGLVGKCSFVGIAALAAATPFPLTEIAQAEAWLRAWRNAA